MFYETERIIRKQQRYVRSKAYETLRSLEIKKLDSREIVACIDVMLGGDNTEIQVDILNLARKIATSKETDNEKNSDVNRNIDVACSNNAAER